MVLTHRAYADEVESALPVVLMLHTAADDISLLETAVQSELAVELETHTLRTISPYRFSSSTLPARTEEIRRLAAEYRAEAVIWLERVDADTVSLQLVVAIAGRATIRSVQADLVSGVEGELVIAARELLNDIRIPVAGTDSTDQSTDENTTDASEPPSSEPASTTPDALGTQPSHWLELGLGADTAGGFDNIAHTPIQLGGLMGVGIHWARGLHAALSLSLFTAPFLSLPDGTFRTLGVRPGVGIGYLWHRKRLYFGPSLDLQVPWQWAEVTVTGRSADTRRWWNFRTILTFDLRIEVHRRLLLSLTPGVAVLAKQVAFERASSGAVVFESSYIEWTLHAALIIRLGKKI